MKINHGTVIMITLYLDDLLLSGSSLKEVLWLNGKLSKLFEMEDCRETHICMGIEIFRNRKRKTLELSRENYIEKILARFGMSESKYFSTPMEHQIASSALNDYPVDETLYRQAVESLMYLVIGTRPDISFFIG